MSEDVAANFVNLYSWASFYDGILNGFKTFTLPNSENSTLWQDFVYVHSRTNTFTMALIFGLFFAFLFWILSVMTGLCTWVDKMWSVFPVFYTFHFTLYDYLYWSDDTPMSCSFRLWIVAVLISVWGARTTNNFYRKGGYSFKFVDYRWTFLKTIISPGYFFLFNIFFICLYQNLLLVLLTLPVYGVQQAAYIEITPLNWIDVVATIGAIGGIVLEHIADNQQWEFYERKRIAIENNTILAGDVKRGFLTSGLFRYSRHPNFFGEMGIWWFVYLFSVSATYPTHIQWFNPTIVGTILLTSLFQSTTPLTEHLSGLKYPAYEQYKKTTSRLIPLFPGRSLDDLEKRTI